MTHRSQTLDNVLTKNRKLLESVPEEVIQAHGVRKEFLTQREHLMVRTINSEFRNKKISEWTMRSLNKF